MLSDVNTFAIGIIAGILVTVGADLIRYYFLRPRLVIGSDRPEIAENYSIHSLIIRNVGRRVSERVQGFISFQRIDSKDVVPDTELKYSKDLVKDLAKFGVTSDETVYLRGGMIREIDNEPLGWAAVDSRSHIDIHPQTGQLLDVCRYVRVEGYQQIQIPSRLGWQSLLTSLRPRNYNIKVTAVGIDTRMVSKKFTMRYEGDDIKLIEGWR